LGHYMVTRGESRRIAELADLSLLQWPKHHGPTPCFGIILKTSNGKTNKYGKMQYMGALRHKDPLLCTMGAIAQYFFWRWHRSGESPPSFRRRRAWYTLKLLCGEKPDAKISYATQYECTWKAFANACINSVKKAHVMRGCGARAAEVHGVADSQVSLAFF
jgi:Centromere DNA-binding protein complex CBF3 subunit, domain 2